MEETRAFDTSNMDTCTSGWTFRMKTEEDKRIIKAVEVKREKQGCEGHSKTIQALMRNVSVDAIDLDALACSNCTREKSCGMVLGECVEVLRKN